MPNLMVSKVTMKRWKSDETPIAQQESEENREDMEAPLALKETNAPEMDKQKSNRCNKTEEGI